MSDELADTAAAAPTAPTTPGAAAPASAPGAGDDLPELLQIGGGFYQVGEEVARGGMGRIRLARDRRLGRTVALKTLLGGDRELALRFEREARITARLQHPAIVPVHEAGRLPNGEPFYAMKWVSGRSLDRVVRDQASWPERLALLPSVLPVVDAVAYAHSQRIIHRDLKPQNVLIGEFGETVVIDWGIAKDLGASAAPSDEVGHGPYRKAESAGAEQTEAGAILGTLMYMPPEQADGRPVTEAADVYALGAILYQVLSGHPPWTDVRTTTELLDRLASGAPPALTTREPAVPRDLAGIVARAMARDAAQRPSARQLADELRQFLTGKLVATHSYSTRELMARWLRRHRAAAAVGAIALATLATVGALSITRIVRERDRAERERHRADTQRLAAVSARERAEATVTQLYVEQGRRDLLEGQHGRAALFLAAAYQRTPQPGAALRGMLAQALSPLEAAGPRLDAGAFVVGARFSADGKQVISVDLGALRSWDAGTGAALASTEVGLLDLAQLGLSADGARMASQHQNGAVRLWDLATRRQLGELDEHFHTNVALSPDGRLLAGVDSTRVTVFDFETRRELWSVGRAADFDAPTILGAALAPSSSTAGSQVALATFGADDGVVRLWQRGGKLVRALTGHRGMVLAGSFSPDGTLLATGGMDHSARIWNVADGRSLAVLEGHRDNVQALAFSPDGRQLATGSWDHTVRLWDVASGALLASFDGHAGMLTSVAFSPDGRQLLSGSFDGTARLWRLGQSAPTLLTHDGAAGSDARFVPGSQQLVESSNPPRLWDTASGRELRTLAPVGVIRQLASGAHAPYLAGLLGFMDEAPGIALWDPATGALVRRIALTESARALALSPDGKLLAVALGRAVVLLDDQGHEVAELAAGDGAVLLEFSRDGRQLVTASPGRARLWDVASRTALREFAPPQLVTALALSPDGKLLVLAGVDQVERSYDVASGELTGTLSGHASIYSRLTFVPDGRLLACGLDGRLDLWDPVRGELLAHHAGHGGLCSGLDVQSDGARVASVGSAGLVELWDIHLEQRSPAEVARLLAERVPLQLSGDRLIPAAAAPRATITPQGLGPPPPAPPPEPRPPAPPPAPQPPAPPPAP